MGVGATREFDLPQVQERKNRSLRDFDRARVPDRDQKHNGEPESDRSHAIVLDLCRRLRPLIMGNPSSSTVTRTTPGPVSRTETTPAATIPTLTTIAIPNAIRVDAYVLL
jgi:hypothetical protein